MSELRRSSRSSARDSLESIDEAASAAASSASAASPSADIKRKRDKGKDMAKRSSSKTDLLSTPKAGESPDAASSEENFKPFQDIMERTFMYNPETNVARFPRGYFQWPILLGPIEVSTRHPSAGKKKLSVKYRELDNHGCVISHDYLAGMQPDTPGRVDRQMSKNTELVMRTQIAKEVKAHVKAGSKSKEVALEVLHSLEYFLPIFQSYHYHGNLPSHHWATDDQGTSYQANFYANLLGLCDAAKEVLVRDDMVVELESPTYVLGDLHGNFRDLQFFASHFWRAGVDICPSNLLFLGDYVDRGPHSVEVIAYLLALKILYPRKVFLLRGNHELESVCGNIDYYGAGSFKSQLMDLAQTVGVRDCTVLWKRFMHVFDWMPLAATIDKSCFCCHAGIPRAVSAQGPEFEGQTIIERIKSLERPLTEEENIDGNPDCVAMDILWADPASGKEKKNLGKLGMPAGFGLNTDRGGDACVFGEEAVKMFAQDSGCDYIIRAHQPPDQGIKYQAGAKVVTVFSSSHYCGMNNAAAMISVSKDSLDIITTGKITTEDVDPLHKINPSSGEVVSATSTV